MTEMKSTLNLAATMFCIYQYMKTRLNFES
jgi:hypothetical protein